VIKGGGALKVASIEKIEGTAEQLIGHDGVGNTHWRGVGGGVLTGKWNECAACSLSVACVSWDASR